MSDPYREPDWRTRALEAEKQLAELTEVRRQPTFWDVLRGRNLGPVMPRERDAFRSLMEGRGALFAAALAWGMHHWFGWSVLAAVAYSGVFDIGSAFYKYWRLERRRDR